MSLKQDIQQKKFSSVYQETLVNILYTANWIDTGIKKILSPYGITHVHFNILRILAGAKGNPLSAGQIKSVMVFKGSDVTRLIDRLIKKGLVDRRTCNENRRKVDIIITKEGSDLLSKVNVEVEQFIKTNIEKKLTEEQAKVLSKNLDLIRK